jgi:transcriptional regulator of arginine metabolism
MIASILDGMKSKEIMGTLAGDDTILLVLREGHPYSEIEQILDGIFPGVKDKCISK